MILLAVVVLMAGMAAGQRRRLVKQPERPDTAAVTKAFGDSLLSLRRHIDTTAVEVTTADRNDMYRLFVRPTFYHDVIKARFGLCGTGRPLTDVDAAVDSALTALYMARPDLVVANETELRQAGGLRTDLDRTVVPDVDIVDKIEMLPDEEPETVPSGVMIKKPNFWAFSGDHYLQFLQNYISDNWYKGGESNYSMVGSVTLNANYNNKRGIKFDNKLEMKLGFQTSRSDTLHKFKTNNDLLRYTGKFGVLATSKWYYTLQLLAYTQFTQGLKSNDRNVYSDFMSPFNLNLGLGMDYSWQTKNKRFSGNVNLAPLSFNFRYVGRKALAPNYGVVGDHHTLEDFGSQITSNLTWNISDQVSWKARVYFYTTYKRTEIEWENTISLGISRFVSANIFLYPRFDDSEDPDDKLGYFQFKEYSALGFTYSF